MISNAWTATKLSEFEQADGETNLFAVPRFASAAANSFFHHLVGALSIFITTVNTAVFADNAAFVANKILQKEIPYPKNFDPYIPLPDNPGPHLRQFNRVQKALTEMIFIRLADNFTTYLLDVVAECVRAKPLALKSTKDQISTDVILDFETMEELREYLIQRKLISFAYLGLDKQLNWLSERLGVADLNERECFPSLIDLVEARNCLVHGRGKIGEKYVQMLAPYGGSAEVGQTVNLSMNDLFIAAKAGEEFVTYLDKMLLEKFNLRAADLFLWP